VPLTGNTESDGINIGVTHEPSIYLIIKHRSKNDCLQLLDVVAIACEHGKFSGASRSICFEKTSEQEHFTERASGAKSENFLFGRAT
jgi:hypothetical protein